MDEKLQHISPRSLTDIDQLQTALVFALNVIEQQSQALENLGKEIQALKDEINVLKGEHGKPKFPKSSSGTQPLKGTGEPKEKKGKGKNHKRGSKKNVVKIDHTETLTLEQSALPADAVLKEYKEYIQQDVRLCRRNTLYRVAIYYSVSEGKTYRADMPDDYRGQFGLGIVSLTQLLHHFGDVTQGRLEALYKSLGVHISAGTISNIITQAGDWSIEEQSDILRSGIEHSPFTQADGTKSVEKGKTQTTQIFCGDKFSVFYTMPNKGRLDILTAVQGKPPGGLRIALNSSSDELMELMKVSTRDQVLIRSLLKEGEILTLTQLEEILAASVIGNNPGICQKIKHALALSHYHQQEDYPIIHWLLTDDAPEYRKLAGERQALCWIHDVRYYRKLIPHIETHRMILKKVLAQYWNYYGKLKQYRKLQADEQTEQKQVLKEEFELIFKQQTDYFQINTCMERTLKNKDKLLAVLDNPALPLHNNAAELGARRVVRKRDISLHTWSEKGTRVKDAFMSIVETAAKLGVNAISYIEDRVSGKHQMMALADCVALAYE